MLYNINPIEQRKIYLLCHLEDEDLDITEKSEILAIFLSLYRDLCDIFLSIQEVVFLSALMLTMQ